MAIKSRNKVEPTFNSSSMSDLVFLLLIFFMLTSTLVAPNAIKLMLPSSSSKTMAKQSITVYINDQYQYFVDDNPADETQLMDMINTRIGNDSQATVALLISLTASITFTMNCTGTLLSERSTTVAWLSLPIRVLMISISWVSSAGVSSTKYWYWSFT